MVRGKEGAIKSCYITRQVFDLFVCTFRIIYLIGILKKYSVSVAIRKRTWNLDLNFIKHIFMAYQSDNSSSVLIYIFAHWTTSIDLQNCTASLIGLF